MDLEARVVPLRCGTGVFLQTLLPSETDVMVQPPFSPLLRVWHSVSELAQIRTEVLQPLCEGGQPTLWWTLPKWSQLPLLSHGA